MAIPTPVNGQITDAVTQANLTDLGNAPAMAMGVVFQALAHSTSLMFANAVNAQQQNNVLAQAATAAATEVLLGECAGEAETAPAAPAKTKKE